MVFSSYAFIMVFLPCVIAATLLARRVAGLRPVIALICLASFVFYAYWDWRFLPVLLFSILFNYFCARQLIQRKSRRRLVLGVGITGNLLTLGYFKYFNFVVDNIQLVIGRDWGFGEVVLPIGISFFTFQQIAYLVDLYRDRRHEYALLDYALFVSFFPQLIAGPIVHHKEMMPQLKNPDLGRFDPVLVSRGIVVFVFGLTKKVLIADTLAGYSDQLYYAAASGKPLSALDSWGAAVTYGLQLYFDFSGYADMAIGLGLIFGIFLPENFDRPYAALSISDFWRRWHITLSRFLRDYLYIPLGGSRVRPARTHANLLITMLLGGIWHGAGWTFLLWGALHGCYLVLQRLYERLREHLGIPALPVPIAWALTMVAVFFAWVPFRAESLAATLVIWEGMLFLGPLLPGRVASSLGTAYTELLNELGFAVDGTDVFLVSEWLWLIIGTIIGLALAILLPNGNGATAALFARAPSNGGYLRGRCSGIATSLALIGTLLYLTYQPVFLYFQF